MAESIKNVKSIACAICVVLLLSLMGHQYFLGFTDNSYSDNEMDIYNAETIEVPDGALRQGTRGSSPRTVLSELFTNWGCGNCPRGTSALHELMDIYDSSQLVVIEYHTNFPSSVDPFYLYNPSDISSRISYYGVGGVPTMYADGSKSNMGGDPTGTYNEYKEKIDYQLSVLSNMTISLEGNLDLTTMNGTINATIDITDSLPTGTLNMRFAVVEDNLYEPGPNGEVRHRNVLRDMLAEETLPPLSAGQTYDVSRSFPIDPALNLNSLSVVVFVQNDNDMEVLQAAAYDFIHQDILVVDDDESGHPLGYEDHYHELLSHMSLAFDGWTLNVRGNPSSSDLSNYDAVIWLTATNFSPTLTTADQTAISEYLDNGKGSIFVTGDNIGSDIGSTPFFQNYLHANYVSSDTGETQISGVENDPITGPFFGTPIPIPGGSPSEIAPNGNASTCFYYSPSGKVGGIKAEHDVDSKVVYFAFTYFEGSDSDSNKMTLMERILNWMTSFADSISLTQGWNLISIPLIQNDNSISNVLSSINGEYDSVQWFNSSDFQDPWKHHHNSKPPEMNDLQEISHEISFWIHITNPQGANLYYEGDVPLINQNISIRMGWNLVGYPSSDKKTLDTALNNINFTNDLNSIWTYSAQSGQWHELGPTDNFEPCNGYWVHSKVDKIWNVPI